MAGTPFPMIFHPEKKECVNVWEGARKNHGFMPECGEEDKEGYYVTPESDKVYFKCPGSEVFFCEEGEIFNVKVNACVKALATTAAATTTSSANNKENEELTTQGEGMNEPAGTTLLKVLGDTTPGSE